MTGLDGTGLMRQACMDADEYLRHAVECIDEQFGDGYAKANPALVAAFMQTAVSDYAAATLGNTIKALSSEISDAVASVAASNTEIAEAINEIDATILMCGNRALKLAGEADDA